MNKVKPQVGQVWKNQAHEYELDYVDSDFVRRKGSKYKRKINIDSFIFKYEFVPQNDLEWLAVNVDKWEGIIHIHKNNSSRGYDYGVNSKLSAYTRQQWQNMRYKLGLDEKPRISAKEWAGLLRNK